MNTHSLKNTTKTKTQNTGSKGAASSNGANSFEDLLQRAQQHPSSLQPNDVLQLQRSLGNTATSKLLKPNPVQRIPKIEQKSPTPNITKNALSEVDRKTIQRLIGFEIETRIPFYYEDDTGTLQKPDYDEVHTDVGTGDGTEIGVDKEGSTSIMELVTGPVDDSQKSADFKATARRWVNVLSTLHANAITGPPPKKMDAAIPSADADLYYGFKPTDSNAQQDLVAIQATHGIRLDKVAEYLASMSIPTANQRRGADKLKSDALAETGPAMDTYMTNLAAILNPNTVITKKKKRTQALKEVRGFFSLLAQYLISGGKTKTYYLKNHTALFYKSKMSDVRTNLINNNIYAAQLLSDTYRANVKTQLLTDTGRNSADALFMGTQASQVTCGDWLDQVFAGTDDPLFNEAKNSWGTDIKPGTVKGNLAAVVEHRDLMKEFKPNDTMTLQNPDEIVDYLVQIFKGNKRMQDIHHG